MADDIAPLVPQEVDLRGYPFTPIFRARLFGSSFHARATDAEWRAGVTLWLKSWDQVPAGTLPGDDIDLCRLAELGRDLKTWAKIKVGAMHGWIKCSDGRLHHPVVAEGVLEAWDGKSKATAKGKAGAAKRWGLGSATAIAQASNLNSSTMPQPEKNNATAMAQVMPSDSNRNREGNREGESRAREVALRARIVSAYEDANSSCSPDTSLAAVWIAQGYDPDLCVLIINETLGRKKDISSLKYFEPAIAEAHAKRKSSNGNGTTDEDRWRNWWIYYKKTGKWLEDSWGPDPTSPACEIPKTLIDQWSVTN